MHMHYGSRTASVQDLARCQRNSGIHGHGLHLCLQIFRGKDDCPWQVVAATEEGLWKLIEVHAAVAHGEDVSVWDEVTWAAVAKLIKTE